ncbi:DegT/DnrJ/EryC1/StrS family aminotransferase [Piscinibacter sp.]|jgi:dTDP-4-amino-4,6-dideoxygalactose transaminase|uniref:DegT/DnrJ/EryC1/StrS family aminotransferase n=1 Tax=Piscinibacter sp. TaxID=1903157 RepID=UPI002F40976D
MILMNDFKAEPAELREAMLGAVQRVLASGWYVLGKECEAFEQNWASICGVQKGVGVGNGMDAIEIAIRALRIGPGDEVITTPMTAFATVLAILRAGAVPVLADIDPGTALLSPDSVRRCISNRTKALVLVHLYGQMRSMSDWLALCEDARISLVEDCAQAHYARLAGKAAGSFGRAGAFSFYPTKNLGAAGDGGMLVTDDAALASAASKLRNYGQSERYHHPEIGMNSRLDEVHAAMLAARLPWMSSFNQRRQAIAQTYRAGLRNADIRLMEPPQEQAAHVYHLFVVTCDHRDALQAHLQRCGIQTLIHYPIPVHRQPPCNELRRDPMGLAASERHAATCLSLPCHPQLDDGQVQQVVDAVNAFAPPA